MPHTNHTGNPMGTTGAVHAATKCDSEHLLCCAFYLTQCFGAVSELH